MTGWGNRFRGHENGGRNGRIGDGGEKYRGKNGEYLKGRAKQRKG